MTVLAGIKSKYCLKFHLVFTLDLEAKKFSIKFLKRKF